MIKNRILLLLFLVSSSVPLQASKSVAKPWWENYSLENTYVITAPVADMVTAPLSERATNKNSEENCIKRYSSLVLSSNPTQLCERIHQCLYNELLLNSKKLNHEIGGTVPYAWYTLCSNGKPGDYFYTHKSNGITLATLQEKKLPLTLIPPPGQTTDQVATITLTLPYYDPISKQLFAAGTRFVHLKQLDTPDLFTVGFIDYIQLSPRIMTIPHTYALEKIVRTFAQKRALFVKILKQWCSYSEKNKLRVPYLLGGSSFIACPLLTMESESKDSNSIIINNQVQPKTGLDCSELVWRVAAITGINLPYKNTFLLASFLPLLKPGKRLEPGDLIWIPGHIYIVLDREKQSIIHASGYDIGTGDLRTCTIADCFEQITTFDQLEQIYHTKKPLKRHHKNGTLVIYPTFKLLKLAEKSEKSAARP